MFAAFQRSQTAPTSQAAAENTNAERDRIEETRFGISETASLVSETDSSKTPNPHTQLRPASRNTPANDDVPTSFTKQTHDRKEANKPKDCAIS